MNWTSITDLLQLNEITSLSFQKPIVIFKHSSRCSISSMILHRLERSFVPSAAEYYFLNVISHRKISNAAAEKFVVRHESPQVLVIKNGECVYDESHTGISMDDIIPYL